MLSSGSIALPAQAASRAARSGRTGYSLGAASAGRGTPKSLVAPAGVRRGTGGARGRALASTTRARRHAASAAGATRPGHPPRARCARGRSSGSSPIWSISSDTELSLLPMCAASPGRRRDDGRIRAAPAALSRQARLGYVSMGMRPSSLLRWRPSGRLCGSNASRRPSPTKVNASMVTAMRMMGMSHQERVRRRRTGRPR